MPTKETNTESYYTVTSTRNIHPRTFEVAESWDLKTSLFEANFRRAIDGTYDYPTGFQLPIEAKFPMLKHSCQVIMFKRALKRELKSKNVTFDQYRTGGMAFVDLNVLLVSCALHVDSIVDIHESDFNNYRSDTLSRLSSYGQYHAVNDGQDRPHYYEINQREVDIFAMYMNRWFIPEVENIDLSKPLSYTCVDTRLMLNDIFNCYYEADY